ncbi:hypothetical protein RUM43_014259 [Polyplax serrata]|uniref:Sugar transporter SWEET n=1 Tax=Polyplax serrata TaxID=468196 RepID=A0AAN8PR10_POLSC
MGNTEVSNLRQIVGTSASVWTILQMLSPVPTCYHFIKTKSVGDMIVTPYVVAFTSCTMWLLYGVIIGDRTVININTVGSALQLSYTLCYYKFTAKRGEVRKQFGCGLFIILAAILYSFYETNSERLISFFGFMCSFITVLFFISPLANMHYIIKIWNSESLPRLLITTTFLVSLQWTLYGYIAEDKFIIVTNFLGTLLSCAQLVLMCIIPRNPTGKYASTSRLV